MITLAQIKAARALLGWTQEKLAKSASLSLPAVNNIERALVSPRESTLAAIERALAEAGVEFLDTTGVRTRRTEFSADMLEGPDWLARYDADIISCLKKADDEILQVSPSERPWMTYGSISNHHYIDHRNKVNFQEKILVPGTIDFVTNRRGVYRALAAEAFAEASLQVYANRTAHILWDQQKILLIRSNTLAESQRAQFMLLWKQAKPFTDTQWKKLEKWEYGGS